MILEFFPRKTKFFLTLAVCKRGDVLLAVLASLCYCGCDCCCCCISLSLSKEQKPSATIGNSNEGVCEVGGSDGTQSYRSRQ